MGGDLKNMAKSVLHPFLVIIILGINGVVFPKISLESIVHAKVAYDKHTEAELDKIFADELENLKKKYQATAATQTLFSHYEQPSWQKIISWTKNSLKKLWNKHVTEKTLQIVAVGATLILAGAILSANAAGKKFELLELTQLLPQNLLLAVPLNMLVYNAITLCHEMGHAASHYCLTGKLPKIFLGTNKMGAVSESLSITPHVELCSLDPAGHGHIQLKPKFLHSLPPETEIAIKKQVLLELAQQYPENSLEEIKKFGIYHIKTSEALEAEQRKRDYSKVSIFYAAGPVAGLLANSVVKTIEGTPLSSITYEDIDNLHNLVPVDNNDGKQLLEKSLHRPDLVYKTEKFLQEKGFWLYSLLGVGYVVKKMHEWNIFSPQTELARTGKIFRLVGASIINLAALGFIKIKPA